MLLTTLQYVEYIAQFAACRNGTILQRNGVKRYQVKQQGAGNPKSCYLRHYYLGWSHTIVICSSGNIFGVCVLIYNNAVKNAKTLTIGQYNRNR